jgi:protease inhibitor Inh
MACRILSATAFGVALTLAAGAVSAQDMNAAAREQVGVPLQPSDAASSPWTLETHGRSMCHVRLGREPVGRGVYRAEVPADCAQALPGGVAGWRPVTDGAALVDSQGQVLIDFNRWSNSLLVAHRGSQADVQLRRGT